MKPKFLNKKKRLYATPSLGNGSLSSLSLFSQSFFSPKKLREGWLLKQGVKYYLIEKIKKKK